MTALLRTLAVANIEWLRLIRSRIAITLLILVPVLQVILFGYAIRPDARVSIAISAPNTETARRVANSLHDLKQIEVVATPGPGQAESYVRSGKVVIGIEVPDIRTPTNPFGRGGPLRVIVDGSNPALINTALARIETAYWRELAVRGDFADSGPGLKMERLYNPNGRADWPFMPGLIGVTTMIAMIMLGALGLAREREGGTWEMLLALPVRTHELIIGKLLPHILIGTVQGLAVVAAGVLLFALPIRGNLMALIALLPLFAAAHFMLGQAIAARAQSQLDALQGAVAFYLPAMLLSGFLYPFDALPEWAQRIGSIFPLTHFIRAATGVLLKGGGWSEISVLSLPIAIFSLVALIAATVLQKRQLD